MSRADRNPLVSCIMPTYNRREFVPHAIRYFQRQGYVAKELIIIDDGEDPIDDLVPEADNIRYYRLESKITLGAKLNMACEYANGEIIANWDDDDWYAERRLNYQATSLQNDQTDVCGINRLLYYDLRQHRAHQYTYPKEHRLWLIGSSLCYRKEFWEMHRFADIDVGMDGLFVWSTTPDRITVLPDTAISVHMIHDRNVSPKKTEGAWWQPHPVDEIRAIMREDWDYYHPAATQYTAPTTPGPIARPPLRNVYACLVHEKRESVLDLVQNLHFHDPESQIILYNGGTDPQLLADKRAFETCGASVHPNPTPMTWGYLHNFALHCMEFALANYTFDTLTIVDSDQLAIRSGYSAFLDKALPSREGIGMLSSKCDRISLADSDNHPIAAQGFKEYELWKPLLDRFPNGADKFLHWTFWPSSVFLSDAIRDLTKLFRENSLLQHIMQNTRIWASEEVILPTLVRLLGYEIRTNPCSYDYVRFRQLMTLADISEAAHKENAFWMHPVDRRFQDPLRAEIRNRARHYTAPATRIVPLISKIQKIGGWLTSEEADTLSGITLRACKAPAVNHHIVEIGSYHGRATVLFGSLIKTFQLQATIHAIDTHDGRLGAEDQGLQSFPPSFEIFNRNIREAGVADVVQVIRDRSTNVNLKAPVSLLFVDGLHDYANVSRDFRQFSAWIEPGAYTAFHDYADYFPGVQAFVNELLLSGEYQKVTLTGSLIILQKRYEQNTTD
jgi:glycosyltransferase involved in cell wall biosynthesis